MRTSPSKLETADLCGRKWWFTFIKKLPTIKKMYFGFGTVLHGCIERYLDGGETDDELFPDRWNWDKDLDDFLPPAESALIQVLVREGIDNGTVERRPDGNIEKYIRFPIDDEVEIAMKLDYHSMLHARLEDHKTSKSTKYLKSAKKLKTNIQMMAYGFWMLKEYERLGKVPPRIITLVHNQFLKDFDKPMARKREAEVTPKQIEDFWNETIIEIVETMKVIATRKDPKEVPGPEKADACNAYGGCDFMTICGGQETMVEYSRRIDRLNDPDNSKEPQMPMTTSGFLNKRNKGGAKKTASKKTKDAPVNPPADDVDETEGAQAAAAAVGELPPWANEECGMCSRGPTPGFSKKGKPCRICLAVTKVDVDEFEYEISDGAAIWWKKGEDKPVAVNEAPEAEDGGSKTEFAADDFLRRIAEVETTEAVAEVLAHASEVFDEADIDVICAAADKRIDAIEAAAQNPKPRASKKRASKKAASKKAASKPAKDTVPVDDEGEPVMPTGGLTLLIGCTFVKGGSDVVLVEEILANVDGYWDNPKAFERREAVRKAVASGDIDLGDMTVVQQGRDPDCDNLISALVPIADTIIRGTIQ